MGLQILKHRVIVLLLLGGCSFAWSAKLASGYHAVDLGLYMSNIQQRYYTPDIARSYVSHLTGRYKVRHGFHLGKNWHFEPGFSFLFPAIKGEDGNTKTYTMQLDLAGSVPLFSFWKFKIGPGIQWDLMSSAAQTIALNNGSSETDFYTPSGTTSVFLFTVLLGFEFIVSEHISLSTEAYIQSIGNHARRSLQATVCLGYRW